MTRRLLRFLRVALLALVLLVLTTLAVTWTLLGTTRGSEWVLREGAGLVGVETRFSAITGSLLGRLELEDLKVNAGDRQVGLGRLILDWRPAALMDRHLDIHELRLRGVTLVLPPTLPEPGEPRVFIPELPAVTLPLAITLGQFELTTLRLGSADAEPLVDRIEGTLSGNGSALELKAVKVVRDTFDGSLDATLDLSGDWPVHATAVLAGRSADLEIAVRVTLDGSVRQPSLTTSAAAPFEATADVAADLRTHPPTARLDVSWRNAKVSGSMLGSPSGALKASTRDRGFDLELRADLDGAPGRVTRVAVTGNGALEAFDAPYAFASELRWSLEAATGNFAGNVRASGNSARIDLDHVLETPFHVTTLGHVMPAGAATTIELAGEWQDLTWPAGTPDAPGSPRGRYSVAGGLHALTAEVDAALVRVSGVSSAWARVEGSAAGEAPYPFQGAVQWKADTDDAGPVAGAGTVSGNVDVIRFEHQLTGPGRLDTAGSVTLSPATILDLRGNLTLPRWPLEGEAVATALDARFAVAGPPELLSAQVDGTLDTADAGPVTLVLSTRVTPDGAQDLELALGVLEGRVTATGQVGWGKAVQATLNIQARGINPRRLHPNAVGALDARVTTDLRLVDGKPAGPVILEHLGGTLGGYPVRGEGRVEILSNGFEAKGIALRSGENTLAMNGRMAGTLELDLDLDAPDLKQIWPGLEGALRGAGRVRGTTTAPDIKGTFDARDLRAGDVRLRSAALRVDASLAADGRSSLTLRVSDLRAAGTEVPRVTLDLAGTPAVHRLEFEADTSHGRFTTTASGAYQDRTWTGRVRDLKASGTALGDWAQTDPWTLKVDPRGAESSEACLASDGARLCVRATRPGADVQAFAANLASLPVARFSPWLPPGLTVSGDLAATASGSRRGTGAWEGRATITPTPILMRLDGAAAGTPVELTLDETRLDARHDSGGSVTEVRSRIGEKGSINGRVVVGPSGKAPATLGGHVEATLPDLTPLRALVPAVTDLAGRLVAALNLSGTLARPRVEGTAALEEASAGVAAAGIKVEDVTLRVNANAGGELRLEGRARSGNGSITLNGEGRLNDDTWSANLGIKGQDFEMVKLIPVHALISPDLQVVASPERLQVRGALHVPEATVDIHELPPDVVAVSGDEVIVGRAPPAASALRRNLDVKVDVTLGPRIRISAFGLKTALDGSLAIAVAGASPPTARGAVSLRDGRFTAYGQDLQVRQGRLLFAGPIDNPGLDVRAVRDAGEVTAGIQVSGTAARIRSRVFSEPPLPQAEALSWLLTGRGLSGASQSDGTALAGAAVALGLDQSAQVTRQIGSSLGIDELSVAPGNSLEESNLVLGKALSPRLYLRYALGVLGGQGSVTLNYKVTDRVSVEAESGEAQGADVLYRLER